MKIFLINLDKNSDRLASFDAQMKAHGLSCERISAVYGKELDPKEKARAVRMFRWWCAVGRLPQDGEIGCALSHGLIYRKMSEERLPVACVFEDDALLGPDIKRVIDYVENVADPNKPQVFLLSNHTRDHVDGLMGRKELDSASGQEVSLTPRAGDLGTEGYCLTLKAAENLLKTNYPLIVPCDGWSRFVRLGVIELCGVSPTMVSQNREDFGSELEKRTRRRSIIGWLAFKSLRAVGKVIDFVLSR